MIGFTTYPLYVPTLFHYLSTVCVAGRLTCSRTNPRVSGIATLSAVVTDTTLGWWYGNSNSSGARSRGMLPRSSNGGSFSAMSSRIARSRSILSRGDPDGREAVPRLWQIWLWYMFSRDCINSTDLEHRLQDWLTLLYNPDSFWIEL